MNSAQSIHEVFESLSPPSDEAKARAHVAACTILDHEPDTRCYVRGNSRDIAVALYREIGARIERGELDGARLQWLDTYGLLRNNAGELIAGLEYTVREAGRVRLRTAEIAEEPRLSLVQPAGVR